MYYPKSQITPNLYSNGDLVFKNSLKLFYGYYYATSDGKFFLGPSPNNNISAELIPIEKQPHTQKINDIEIERDTRFGTLDNLNYSNLNRITPSTPIPQNPKPYISSPTPNEKEIGEYQRYFSKKNNQNLYMEISKDTYNKFINQDPKIAFNLYEVTSIPWSLTNSNVNSNITSLIEKNLNWYRFSDFNFI
jgi:hypothetical protein